MCLITLIYQAKFVYLNAKIEGSKITLQVGGGGGGGGGGGRVGAWKPDHCQAEAGMS